MRKFFNYIKWRKNQYRTRKSLEASDHMWTLWGLVDLMNSSSENSVVSTVTVNLLLNFHIYTGICDPWVGEIGFQSVPSFTHSNLYLHCNFTYSSPKDMQYFVSVFEFPPKTDYCYLKIGTSPKSWKFAWNNFFQWMNYCWSSI